MSSSAGLILTAVTGVLLRDSGAHLSAGTVLGLVYGGIVVATSGLVLVLWTLGDTRVPKLALAIVLGSLATSLVLVAGYFLTGQRAGVVFVCWSALVAAAAWPTLRRMSSFVRIDLDEGVSVVAIALLVTLWCRPTAGLLPAIHSTGTVTVWSDYFIFGTEIAQFGDRMATGRASFALSDQPIGLYHFAPFMLPAAVSTLVDLPSLGLASSVLFPYGILAASLGAYILARTLGGTSFALLVPFALLLLPDASTHGLRNGFFSFHWFLGAVPGSGHGLGAAFTSLAFYALWRKTGRAACLWVTVLVALALFQVRALLFLLFVPVLLTTALWETAFVQRHARRFALATVVAVATIVVLIALIPPARQTWVRFTALGAFLEIVHTAQTPSAYDGAYRLIEHRYGLNWARAIGFLALTPCVLGSLTIVLPAAMTIAIRRTGWRLLDSFPLWCLLGWLSLVLVAPPTSYGDPATYQYHAFVMVYATALVWTLLALDRALGYPFERSGARSLASIMIVAAVGIAVAAGTGDNPVKPRLTWGAEHFGNVIAPGLLDAAAFVHARAVPGDTFALLPMEPSGTVADQATRFAALANVPAYLTRPAIHIIRPNIRGIVEQRLTQLHEIESTTDPDEAFDKLRRMGITFLVVLGQQGPHFDPSHARPAFRARGAAVYRIAPK